jgi:hypothetical protein
MGWFGDLLETIDRPSNALQGFAIDGVEGLKRGWSHEENYDFEQLIDEDLAKKSWSERNKKEKASYMFTGLANLVVDPLNFVGVGAMAKGLKATKTAAGKISPLGYVADRGMLSEMPNRLEYFGVGFYEKGLPSKAMTSAMGAGEGFLRSVNRELNPAMLKKQKFFKKTGIPTATTSVVDNVMSQVSNPQLQSMATNIASKTYKNRTKKERKFLQDWENLGKILQGQLGWNYLEKDAYKLGTKLDEYKKTHFFGDDLPLTKESFIQGSKQFSDVADEAYQLSDDILSKVFDKVLSNQGVKKPMKNRLYFKKPTVSNANALRISNEVASGSAKKRKAAGELFSSGKPFNSIDELSDSLSKKEWTSVQHNWKGEKSRKLNKGVDHTVIKGKDGKDYVMFTDSYLSGDNLLGGVNVITLVDKNGKVFSFVNDTQDIFKFKFPGGQTPLVVTPALTGDFLGNTIKKIDKVPSPSKEGMMLGGKMTSTMSRPSLSPQLYESAQAIQRMQKDMKLNPLDYLTYLSKVNMATEPLQE